MFLSCHHNYQISFFCLFVFLSLAKKDYFYSISIKKSQRERMTDKQKKRKKVSKNYVIFEISNTQDGLLFARLTRENGSFQCNTLWDCLSVHALITIDLFTDTAAILSK